MYLNNRLFSFGLIALAVLLAFAFGLGGCTTTPPGPSFEAKPAWWKAGFAEKPVCQADEDGAAVEWTPWCGCLPPSYGSDC